jgi:hypothetical protein
MFNNSRDFYQKLLEEFDDYFAHQDSERHAMNFAVTAHHMADWVWGDIIKNNHALKAKLGVREKNDFMQWIDSRSIWYGLVQAISNGSKHFIRQNGAPEKIQGWGMGGYGQGPYGRSYLAIDVSQTDPRYMPLAMLFEVVVRFWRDFLRSYSPFKEDLPEGKTKLSES